MRLDGYHSQLLLDYITNLQQENERLKVELNKYKAKQKLETDIKMQQSYLDYYRTITRGDKEWMMNTKKC